MFLGSPGLGIGRTGMRGGGFSPASIPNLRAWYRSDTSLTGSSPITAWGDKSGSGFALGTAAGPTRVVADVNGHDSVSFDGVDDYLDVAGFGAAGFPGLTQFLVMRYEDQASYGMYTSIGDSVGDGSGLAGDEIRNNAGQELLNYATAGDPGPVSAGMFADQWIVVTGTHVGPTGALNLYVNGTLVATAPSSGALCNGTMAFGRRNNGGGFYAKYKTPEKLFYGRVLTAQERGDVEAYLYQRYAITP